MYYDFKVVIRFNKNANSKISEFCSENLEDGRRSIPPRIPKTAEDYYITVRDMYYLPLDRI